MEDDSMEHAGYGEDSDNDDDREEEDLDPDTASSLTSAPMSRSTSTASTALSTRSIGELLQRIQKRNRRRNRAQERSGRMMTAFVRKIGACESCRASKVRCKHFDPSLYEAFRASRKPSALVGPTTCPAAPDTVPDAVHDAVPLLFQSFEPPNQGFLPEVQLDGVGGETQPFDFSLLSCIGEDPESVLSPDVASNSVQNEPLLFEDMPLSPQSLQPSAQQHDTSFNQDFPMGLDTPLSQSLQPSAQQPDTSNVEFNQGFPMGLDMGLDMPLSQSLQPSAQQHDTSFNQDFPMGLDMPLSPQSLQPSAQQPDTSNVEFNQGFPMGLDMGLDMPLSQSLQPPAQQPDTSNVAVNQIFPMGLDTPLSQSLQPSAQQPDTSFNQDFPMGLDMPFSPQSLQPPAQQPDTSNVAVDQIVAMGLDTPFSQSLQPPAQQPATSNAAFSQDFSMGLDFASSSNTATVPFAAPHEVFSRNIQDGLILIGKHGHKSMSEWAWAWECQYKSGRPSSVYGSESETCSRHYETQLELETHFRTIHMPFEFSCTMYRCSWCTKFWPEQTIVCPNCSLPEVWQTWCCGFSTSAPNPMPELDTESIVR